MFNVWDKLSTSEIKTNATLLARPKKQVCLKNLGKIELYTVQGLEKQLHLSANGDKLEPLSNFTYIWFAYNSIIRQEGFSFFLIFINLYFCSAFLPR